MNTTAVHAIGAALGVCFLAFVFLYPTKEEAPTLSIAPEVVIPMEDLTVVATPLGTVSPLFGDTFGIGYTNNQQLFLADTLSQALTDTTSPAAAAAGGTKNKKTASSTSSGISAKAALTANTQALRGAAVNVLCMAKDGSIPSVSGSGVIIDPRGIILTVAHVAQMYLLQDYPTPGNVRCTIRTGSPAISAYTAELVYISPTWIKKYPDTLVAVAPTGTGAHDFAFLAITGSTTGAPLPSTFPSVPLSSATPKANEAVGVGTYGAQYLDNVQKMKGLYQTMVYGVITKPFTFTTNDVEALSIRAGSAAQLGSSGGGVVNTRGEYIGLVTNSAITGDFSTRELRAITPHHLEESFSKDMDEDLNSYLESKSVQEMIADFASTAQTLRQLVIGAIN